MSTPNDIFADRYSLLFGDCLERLAQLPEHEVDLVLADMPYGTTQCKWDQIIPLDKLWPLLKCVAKKNTAFVFTASQPFTSVLVMSNVREFKYDWVWDKVKGTGFLNAKKMPMRNHESVCVFYSKLPTYNPQKTYGHKRKVSFRAKHLQTDVYGEMQNDYTYDSTERNPRSIQVISTDTQNSSLHPHSKTRRSHGLHDPYVHESGSSRA